MLDDIRVVTLIITTCGVVITALLTHFFTSRREKYEMVYEYKLKILTEVYTPIYRYLMDEVDPGDEYSGFDVGTYMGITGILESNIHLIEPVLESMLWQLNEQYHHMEQERTSTSIFDKDKKFMRYIVFQYNLLRKELGLPYSKSSIGFKKRIQMNFKENQKVS
ncbi:hypothetical protein P4485_16810 [Bacillus thuringiensis]|nr:hypothetical protein [Bacillus thuringiensis]